MNVVAAPERRRVRARVEGTVQGVGFRPYVFRLASELGLDGWVLNDSAGVMVEVEAAPASVDRFFARLAIDAPPLASVERVAAETLPPAGLHGFEIRPSPTDGEPNAAVTPDGATCDDCLRELFDPADRRYRYPFINCTNCGPRFTIVRGVPYDRPNTTMAAFEMCPECRAEYENPADRRFHAQPNACPACGPRLRMVTVDAADPLAAAAMATDDAADPLASAAMALRAGAIAAVKGIGGFHLACRADDENAVATLRSRKHREDKPFALMVADAGVARSLVDLRHEDEALLRSRMRPIVLAPRLSGADVASSVAPASRELGLMLPYSPLHHLLLAACGTPLVMTSGNVSDEPIAFHDDDALERLSRIADLFLLHDRPIHTRTDDSVVRTVGRRTMVLRRSRGYVPDALKLPITAPRAIVACGAEQKNTFCVAKGERAWVGHHVGDLENWETLRSFTHGIDHFERLFAVEPTVVAHDLHPEYLSTKYALARDGLDAIGVQHHHAHLAACLAEHGELGTAVGAIFDGTGYGTDGTIWGGELLVGDIARAERAGMLWPVRMPGAAAAIREPWRMACAWLDAAGLDADAPPAELAGQVPGKRWREIRDLARAEVASPVTSSAGRLFDAVAALCGIRPFVNYEGQAAIELEAACDPAELERYEVALLQRHGRLVVDVRPAISAVAGDLARGTSVAAVAARFHNTIAAAVGDACAVVARRHRTRTVVLSGGVFQNRRLLEDAAQRLNAAGLRTLVPERLPVNDGGISYGQAVVAATRLARLEADGRT